MDKIEKFEEVEDTMGFFVYNAKVIMSKRRILEELENDSGDGVFAVTLHFRDKYNRKPYIIYPRGGFEAVFKNFSSVKECIAEMNDRLYGVECKEPLYDRIYWEIKKYKLEGSFVNENDDQEDDDEYEAQDKGEYSECARYTFSLTMDELLTVFVLDKNESEAYSNWPNSRQLILPFERGDIIKVNAKPLESPFYVVYGGERRKGEAERWEKKGSLHYEHYCLGYSPITKDIEISELDEWRTNYYRWCELAEDCTDKLLVKASKILKKHPDVWYKWCSRYFQDRNDKEFCKWIIRQDNTIYKLCRDASVLIYTKIKKLFSANILSQVNLGIMDCNDIMSASAEQISMLEINGVDALSHFVKECDYPDVKVKLKPDPYYAGYHQDPDEYNEYYRKDYVTIELIYANGCSRYFLLPFKYEDDGWKNKCVKRTKCDDEVLIEITKDDC